MRKQAGAGAYMPPIKLGVQSHLMVGSMSRLGFARVRGDCPNSLHFGYQGHAQANMLAHHAGTKFFHTRNIQRAILRQVQVGGIISMVALVGTSDFAESEIPPTMNRKIRGTKTKFIQRRSYLVSSVRNRRNLVLAWLSLVPLIAFHGCATVQPEDGERWRESQRATLKARAESRWDALIKGDVEKAYTFTTPEYRAVVSPQQYRGKYGRVVDWQVARVVNVSYDDPTVATVSVEVTYRVSLPGLGGQTIETPKVIPEKWIYKNREWWYIAN